MPPTFAWLDQSEEQRRKVLDIVDLFNEQGTVDELGLGTIRDAMADILFPGTSNLMTVAAYYLFVPWMYLRLEGKHTPSSEVAEKGRREELQLIERLLDNGGAEGVIGRRARKSLRRLPSGLYWAGLRRLGICLFDGSQDAYHRSLDAFYRRREGVVVNDDGEALAAGRGNWHLRLPPAPKEWPASAVLTLTKPQAEFLRDQISLAASESLFAHLLRQTSSPSAIEFPWAHSGLSDFSEKIRWQLGHAQNFSAVMHGAALIYNLMLAELTKNGERVEEYEERLRDWAEELGSRDGVLRQWDRADAWCCFESEGARIPRPTHDFVDRWCEMAIHGDRKALPRHPDAQSLIADREKRLKGSLARIHNQRARELWQGASSAQRIQYRWSNAAVIVDNIVSAIHPVH